MSVENWSDDDAWSYVRRYYDDRLLPEDVGIDPDYGGSPETLKARAAAEAAKLARLRALRARARALGLRIRCTSSGQYEVHRVRQELVANGLDELETWLRQVETAQDGAGDRS